MTNFDGNAVNPSPTVHSPPPEVRSVRRLTPRQIGAIGTVILNLVLRQICLAIAGIEIFGIKPFDFLRGWADELQKRAQDAYFTAIGIDEGLAAGLSGSGDPSSMNEIYMAAYNNSKFGIGGLNSTANTAETNAADAISKLATILYQSGEATFAALGKAIKDAADGLGQFLANAATGTAATIGTLVNGAIKAAEDFGTFLTNAATGTAATVGGLVAGAISNANTALTNAGNGLNQIGQIINNVGTQITGAVVTTATQVGQAIGGAIQGTIDTWNNFWGAVLGGSPPSNSAASVASAAGALKNSTTLAQTDATDALGKNVLTNLAIYRGYYGSGGSGVFAEAQAVIEAIKTKIDSGYTLQTLTFDSGTKKQDVAVFYVLNYSPSGTLTLKYKNAVTAGISAMEAASTVQDKLQRLSTIGTGNATASYAVISSSGETQYNYQTVLAPVTQTVTIDGAPTGGTFTLTYKGQTTSALPYNASAAQVQTALNALNNTNTNSASLSLNGSGDYLVIPYTSNYDLSSGDWTIESWFNFASSSGGMIIAKDTYGVNYDWGIYVTPTAASIYSNGATTNLSVAYQTLSSNTWHHVAAVRQSGVLRIYINGVQRGGTSTMAISNASQVAVTVGCTSWNNPGNFFNGKISNLRIVKGTAVYPNGTTFTPSTTPLTEIANTVMLLFKGGAFNQSASPYTRYGDATTSTSSPFTQSFSEITVSGSNGGPYTLNFSTTLPSIEMVTATASFTGGILPTIAVTDDTVYGKITGDVSGMTVSATGTGGEQLDYVASIPYWVRPFTVDEAPKEFYAIGWGSGGGGQVGPRVVSNNTLEVAGGGTSYGAGGGVGGPGGFLAVEIDAAQLPSEVSFRIAAGGNPNYSRSVLAGSGTPVRSAYSLPAETNFGTYLKTVVGQYTVINLLGYYTSNLSAPASGGAGGITTQLDGVRRTYGVAGSAGGSTPLASGGAGGSGSRWTSLAAGSSFTSYPAPGSPGGDATLTGKSKSGGGGGGGGGCSWNGYDTTNGYWGGFSGAGGVGGNGGRPGGGGGGGGAGFTYDVNSIGAANIPGGGIAAGNGGYGGHGIIVLLWK